MVADARSIAPRYAWDETFLQQTAQQARNRIVEVGEVEGKWTETKAAKLETVGGDAGDKLMMQ